MKKISIKLMLAVTCGMFASAALAKLPPLSEEAKAKADEAKAKAAWGEKVAGYKLCLSQDKVAAGYVKANKVDTKAFSVTAPPCADPGPYVAPVAAAPAAAGAPAVVAAAAPAAPAAAAKPAAPAAPAKSK